MLSLVIVSEKLSDELLLYSVTVWHCSLGYLSAGSPKSGEGESMEFSLLSSGAVGVCVLTSCGYMLRKSARMSVLGICSSIW